MLLLAQYETASKSTEIPGFQALEKVARSLNSRSVDVFDVTVRTCMYGNARPHALYAALASGRIFGLTAVDVIGRSVVSAHQSHAED